MLDVKVIHKKYEDIVDKEDFDFFITDHIASTVFPHMINFSKPTILFDFNLTEINKLILKDLQNSTYIIKSKQDKKNMIKEDVLVKDIRQVFTICEKFYQHDPNSIRIGITGVPVSVGHLMQLHFW